MIAIIYSPLGNGQMLVGRWARTYSPKDMIVANPSDHGVRVLRDTELKAYTDKHGGLMPCYPGEWTTIEGEL